MCDDWTGASCRIKTRTAGTESNENFSNSGERGDQPLLPGIPDRITVDLVCTKLPFKAFGILSSVSPAWRQAIRSHCVYNARVLAHSTETLVVHNHYSGAGEDDAICQVVALYSMRDKRCYELPGIPGVERGIPWSCKSIALDGKIYVLGGAEEYDIEEDENRKFESIRQRLMYPSDDRVVYKEVYVFDLAGQGQWKRCASMQEGRHRFACGVMNGKIYVFGGAGPSGPVHGSEAYDPEGDAWSPIKPMPRLRFRDHRVATLGEELAVYGGVYYDTETAMEADENEFSNHEWIGYDFAEDALYLEVYHPLKDEWRVVDPFLPDYLITPTVFVAREKLHELAPRNLHVFDSDTKSWRILHKNSFAAIGPPEAITVVPTATAIVNDQLLAGVGWRRSGWRRKSDSEAFGTCLVEGRGFGSEDEEVTWQVLSRCRAHFDEIMYTMQL